MKNPFVTSLMNVHISKYLPLPTPESHVNQKHAITKMRQQSVSQAVTLTSRRKQHNTTTAKQGPDRPSVNANLRVICIHERAAGLHRASAHCRADAQDAVPLRSPVPPAPV